MSEPEKVSAVYFLLDEPQNAVKIGRTVDTERRLRELQVGGSSKLRYLGWLPGGPKEEAALHSALSQYRVRGEWFRLVPHVRALIEGVCAAQRQRLDAEEEQDVLRALQATHDIVCKRKTCKFA